MQDIQFSHNAQHYRQTYKQTDDIIVLINQLFCRAYGVNSL